MVSIYAYTHIRMFKKHDGSDLTVELLGHIQYNQNTNEGEEHEVTTSKVQNLCFMIIDA